jgi:hypothetical protein
MAEETWQDRVWAKRHEVAEQVTRDFLRPALAAAGVDDVDKYEVSWVREDGFRPGLFAQDGDGTCAVGYSCPPWPSDE